MGCVNLQGTHGVLFTFLPYQKVIFITYFV